MKKIKLLILTACIGFSAYAQKTISNEDFTIRFGFPYEIPKGYQDLGYFGNDETGFAQISYKPKKELIIQNFDKNLKAGKEKIIDIKDFPPDFQSDAFLTLGKKYFWFFSTYSKPEKKESLWVQEINLKEGKLIGERKELLENSELEGDLVAMGGFYNFAKGNKYLFQTSIDSSKILITYRLLHKSKNDAVNKEQVGFCVIDGNLTILDNNVVNMPYTEKRMDNEDYEVDKFGNAFLLAKVYGDGESKSKEKGKPDHHFEVFRIQHGSKGDMKNIKLDTESKYITDILITEQSTGDIVVTGFYSNKKQKAGGTFKAATYGSDGAFVVKIDGQGNPTNFGKGYYEFPAEALKQFMTEREKKKMEKKEDNDDLEAAYLEMRNVISHADGSMEIIGEESYSVTRSNGRSSYTTYYYQDILDLRIDSKGELLWVKKIPKNQAGSAPAGGASLQFGGLAASSLSFYAYPSNNKTYLFYTDNIKNLKLAIDQAPARHSDGLGGYLVYYKVDQNGQVTKGDLFDYKKEGIKFAPFEFQQIGKKTLANRAYKGAQSRVVVVSQK